MARVKAPAPDELRKLLAGVTLVNLTAAARLLGIAPPNVSRLRQQGRFPEPVTEIEGGAGVYDLREVEALATELGRERDARHDGGRG